MDDSKVRTCCICGQRFIGWGNNPWPVVPDPEFLTEGEDAVCCDECNYAKVIPARLDCMGSAGND